MSCFFPANTKEEDPTGLLCEGQRYRDLETGVFITPDPLGMVDGPNLYAYVMSISTRPSASHAPSVDHCESAYSMALPKRLCGSGRRTVFKRPSARLTRSWLGRP